MASASKEFPDPHSYAGRHPAPSDQDEVLREQLDYLIAHAQDHGLGLVIGCPDCKHYVRTRDILLENFAEVTYDVPHSPAPGRAGVRAERTPSAGAGRTPGIRATGRRSSTASRRRISTQG